MITLEGQHILLRPMQISDATALVHAASDGELWNLPYSAIPSADTVSAYIAKALAGRDEATVMPFVTVVRKNSLVVGSTRFWKIDRDNRKLEIGSTWIAASWQRTAVNTEAKYLMLRHAFEVLKCVRVQFTTDVLNKRSREAILRLGAVEEGVIRKERIMPNGRQRDSVRYSIIDDEWPGVRESLEQKLAAWSRSNFSL